MVNGINEGYYCDYALQRKTGKDFFPLWNGQGLEPPWCAPEKTDNVADSKAAMGLQVCRHYKYNDHYKLSFKL